MDDLANRTEQITLNDSSKCLESKSSPDLAPFVASHLEVVYSSLKALPGVDFFRDIQHETTNDGTNNGVVDPLASLAALREYMASPVSSAMGPVKQQNYFDWEPIVQRFRRQCLYKCTHFPWYSIVEPPEKTLAIEAHPGPRSTNNWALRIGWFLQ